MVEECAAAGIEEVIVVVSPSEVEKFESYFYGKAINLRTLMVRQGKNDRWSKVEKIFNLPTVTIVPQDERLPYGNGSPILTVKDFVAAEEAFAILFGDDIVISEVSATKQLIDEFIKRKPDVMFGVQTVIKSELHRYGVIKLKQGTKDQVERVVEKPEPGTEPSNLVTYGRFVVTPKVFDYLVPTATGKDDELWLQDANHELAQNGVALIKEIDGEWMTTGDPLRYLMAHIKYALSTDKFGADIKKFIQEICD